MTIEKSKELYQTWKHLVISGCSFSAGTSDPYKAMRNPEVWPHFVLQKLQCPIFANLAMPGGGNLAAGINLIYYLDQHFCDPQTTLVLFNVTEFDRIDTATRYHPDSNPNFSWSEDMGIEWITEGSFLSKLKPFHGMLQKNMGYETTVLFNVLQSLLVHEYLHSRAFDYRWMYMSDRCRDQIPGHLRSTMHRFEKYQIKFGEFASMYEYVASMSMLQRDNLHPDMQGHKKIAHQVLEALEPRRYA